MSNKRFLSHHELRQLAGFLAQRIYDICRTRNGLGPYHLYAVPRGGVPVLYLLLEWFRKDNFPFVVADIPANADVIIDDLIDSGTTKTTFSKMSTAPFVALIEKGVTEGFPNGQWIAFPWEQGLNEDQSAHDIFTRLLQFIGEDATREGLKETPARMAKAWAEWTSGYAQDPHALLKTFEDGAETCDEMVIEHNIPFYSQCEHHMAPFFGNVTFAYLPDKKVVGLSKMNRLVDVFARRLQVQERLTSQIVDAFVDSVKPHGCAAIVTARHLCMESRGIRQHGISTTTSALRGRLKDGAPRNEFLMLANAHLQLP